MKISSLLGLQPGVTAVIGSGGKTTFLRVAGEELAAEHRVLLCTTTKIFPFDGIPTAQTLPELEKLLEDHSLVCGGTLLPETGKLGPLELPMEQLLTYFDYILVEADGAARRPLKAHAAHEPVIPSEAGQVLTLVGASGFGEQIQEVAHRPERYAELAGCGIEDYVTPERAAAVLRQENLSDLVFVNQVEEIEQLAWVGRFAGELEIPVYAGALQKGEGFRVN